MRTLKTYEKRLLSVMVALALIDGTLLLFWTALPTVHKPGYPVAGDTLQWWSGVNPEWPANKPKQLLTPIARNAE